MKVFLWLLAGGGLLALVCCGGMGIFFYQVGKSVQPTQVPAEVNARTQEMVTITVPERFVPQMAMSLAIFGQKFAMANYTTAAGDGHFGVIEMSVPFDQAKLNGDQVAKQQAQNMRNAQQQPGAPAGGPKELNVDPSQTRTEERDIRGQKCPVTYSQGTQPGSPDKVVKQLMVVIPGKTPATSVILQLQLPEADWDDAEIEAMLKSIQ